jgi:hypothetical protein
VDDKKNDSLADRSQRDPSLLAVGELVHLRQRMRIVED